MKLSKERRQELREWAEEFSFDHMLVGVRKDELLALLDMADENYQPEGE